MLVLRKSAIETDAICATAVYKDSVSFCFHGQGGNVKTMGWAKVPVYSDGMDVSSFLEKMADETEDTCWTLAVPENALSEGVFPIRHLAVVMNAAYVTLKFKRGMNDFAKKVANDLHWNEDSESSASVTQT
jgi:hypothetical protein